ncbi:MAG: GNAT family N-acetyltransferase [Methylococcaceae bacterium]|nr:GNAT family N-acetyltransferase [Methylococcaceae bacterium]
MIAIRLVQPADIPHLVTLLNALFTLESDFVVDADKQTRGLKLLLETDTAGVWAAEELETLQVVGMCSVQTLISTAEGGRVGLLEDLIVATAFRQQGIATQLLAQVNQWAEERGLTRLQLLADKHNQLALDFYARKGWQVTQLINLKLKCL